MRLAGAVPGGRVEGVELSDPMLGRVRDRICRCGLTDRVRLHAGSVEALPFDSGQFDCACSVNTIYFWPDLHRGLTELARVLRPGGRLVLGFGSDETLRRAGYNRRRTARPECCWGRAKQGTVGSAHCLTPTGN